MRARDLDPNLGAKRGQPARTRGVVAPAFANFSDDGPYLSQQIRKMRPLSRENFAAPLHATHDLQLMAQKIAQLPALACVLIRSFESFELCR